MRVHKFGSMDPLEIMATMQLQVLRTALWAVSADLDQASQYAVSAKCDSWRGLAASRASQTRDELVEKLSAIQTLVAAAEDDLRALLW